MPEPSEPSIAQILALSIIDLRCEFENDLRILQKLENQLQELPGTQHPAERMAALAVMIEHIQQLATSNATVRAEVSEAVWHLERLLGERES